MIWNNLYAHPNGKMRAFTHGHLDWLTVIQLPVYALPVEGACKR